MDKLIIGLGNPGLRYRQTKHNAGFWVADALAQKQGIALRRRLFPAQWGKGRAGGIGMVICKPLTYMNRSGIAVQQCSAYFGIGPADMLVVYDDVTLALGRLRFRPAGSAGGHNGLRSIQECMGTERIPRLRLGIGTEEPAADLAAYVLRPFTAPRDKKQARQMVETATTAVECWAREGLTAAMNQFNRAADDDDEE